MSNQEDSYFFEWYFENLRKTDMTLVCQDTEIDKEAWEAQSNIDQGQGIPKRELHKEEWTWVWCVPEYRGIPLIAVQPKGGPFKTPQKAIYAMITKDD